MANQPTVLVVEDDAELRMIYRQTLERVNYQVVEAFDGADAIQQTAEFTPDVIILDMMMPRMGGPTVLQLIRQNPALEKTRLVVITAYPQFRESALKYDVDLFLTKPVRPIEIINAVKTALESD
ncbi:MAG: response regulator [Chloroflexi bacterium]|nr:response regulator [Chloroflexota bacterium]